MPLSSSPINRDFWRKLWLILQPFQSKIIRLSVIIGLMELTKLISPYLFKLIIDRIAHFDAEKIKELIGLTILAFFSDSIISLMHYFKDKKIFAFLIDLEYHLPIILQQKLVSLSLGFHEKENTGNKIIKVQRGVDKLDELMVNACWEFWPTITQITFTFLAMLYFNWRISLTFALFVPIFIFITLRMNRLTNPLRRRRHEGYEQASGLLGQSIINIYTVQSFVQELKETKRYRGIRDQISAISKTEWNYVIKFNLLRNFIIDLGRFAVVLYSAYLAWHGQISLGSLVFFITLSETAYHSLFRLSRTYDRLIESSTGVERITSLLEVKPTIVNQPKIKPTPQIKGVIKFNHVSFSYHKDSKTKALINVNLQIKPGETAALVGPSGGGKSTMVKLLYRHYDVTAGQIMVDGHDIRDYDLYEYRSQLAIVPQDVEIFNTSLRENIAYGKTKAGLGEIKKAARAANLDFIDKLDQGFNTLVGERGVKLSGGQKQRVGIARALLARPSILIFDEATSNLDTHSERLIQASIAGISAGATTMIIIAHRLSTVISADKIFVINQGKIAESGSHQELMENKDGIYSELLRLQAIGELK